MQRHHVPQSRTSAPKQVPRNICRARLAKIAAGDLDNVPIAAAFAKSSKTPICAFAKGRSRGQHANEQDDDALCGKNWFGKNWSRNYPEGLFEWKWVDGGGSLDTWGNANGTMGWATIIRSSSADYVPGMYRVHHCAHMPCPCLASMPSHASAWMFGLSEGIPLHLFTIDPGIAMLNVPQSRNAAEAGDVSSAVAGPSPPSPTAPTRKRKTPEEYVRSGGRLTANEIAVKKMGSPILQLSKSKKDKTDKKSNKDTKNKKDKKGKNDKKYEKAKKTEKGRKDFAMTLTIKPGIDYDYDIACQKEESTMTLQVSGFDTIGEVKRMIEDMRRLEGRPPAIYSNRVGLADAYTLSFIFGKQWGFADANTLMFYNIPGRAHLSLEEE